MTVDTMNETGGDSGEAVVKIRAFGRLARATSAPDEMPDSPHALLRIAAEEVVEDVAKKMGSDQKVPSDFGVEVAEGDVSRELAEREVERALLEWVNHFRDGKVKGKPVLGPGNELDREHLEDLEEHHEYVSRRFTSSPVHVRQGRAHVLATRLELLVFNLQRESEYLP